LTLGTQDAAAAMDAHLECAADFFDQRQRHISWVDANANQFDMWFGECAFNDVAEDEEDDYVTMVGSVEDQEDEEDEAQLQEQDSAGQDGSTLLN
jgi:hypothetical protein